MSTAPCSSTALSYCARPHAGSVERCKPVRPDHLSRVRRPQPGRRGVPMIPIDRGADGEGWHVPTGRHAHESEHRGTGLTVFSITLAGVSNPARYRPAPGTIPDSPGVYRFRDPGGRVIYVGKAKSLRQRLNSYFADIGGLHPRTAQMVTSAGGVEWTVVSTEVEALQLEYNWIKEFDPRFNVRYRDDKSYPELAVTLGEEYPRLQVMRGPHRKGVRYFGPYSHAWAIRETLDLLLRVFPARTCSAGVFRRSEQIGRPCLLGYIGKCSAPCTGQVTAEQHRAIVNDFCDFMSGRADPMIRRLEKEMTGAAAELDFERAARLRDDLGALRRAVEKQAVVLGDGTDADVVGIAADDLLASVQVFHVRGGRVRGQRGWIVDVDNQVTNAAGVVDLTALVENFLLLFYGARADDDGAAAVPKEILVPALPAAGQAETSDAAQDADRAAWVQGVAAHRATRRQTCAGRDRHPQRSGGARAAPAQTGQRPDRPIGRADRAGRHPRDGHGAAAHRVHRHLTCSGHRRGRVPGGLRGRPAQTQRLPQVRDPRPPR